MNYRQQESGAGFGLFFFLILGMLIVWLWTTS
jgi:hypothetical protein